MEWKDILIYRTIIVRMLQRVQENVKNKSPIFIYKMENKIRIIAISGSLRNNSSATFILKHVIKLFPGTIDFVLYEGIGKLPHFDDNENANAEVTAFRQLLTEADGVFICQPEYAFGV